MEEQTIKLAEKLEQFRPLIERVSTVEIIDAQYFQCYLISSFVKAFEYAVLTTEQEASSAFFLTSALRSTTEDLIFLNYLSKLSQDERELALGAIVRLETSDALKYQNEFFGRFRPFQAVIPTGAINTQKVDQSLRKIWRDNGWPNFPNRGNSKPPTREVAQKSDRGLLEVVYEYVYRLSSNAVHFRPSTLLRQGWGKTPDKFTFSSKNYSDYHLKLCQVYGSFLFCLYFELFGDFIGTEENDSQSVIELRQYLMYQFRWPEMTTFEEMNIPIRSSEVDENTLSEFYDEIVVETILEGFISGARKTLKSSSD